MAGTLTIGDFARATHLSVKALRHYHRIGLLVPAEVDRVVGVPPLHHRSDRHARRSSVASATWTCRSTRSLACSPTDDLEAAQPADHRHLDRLEQALTATQTAVRSLRDLLGSSTPAVDRAAQRRRRPRRGDHGGRRRGRARAVVPRRVRRARRHPRRVRCAPHGPAAGLYDTDLFAHGRRRRRRCSCRSTDDRSTTVGRVPGSRSPPSISPSPCTAAPTTTSTARTASLAAYVADHAISLDGPIRETYLTGFRDTPDDGERWSTEIGWPIFHPGPPAAG